MPWFVGVWLVALSGCHLVFALDDRGATPDAVPLTEFDTPTRLPLGNCDNPSFAPVPRKLYFSCGGAIYWSLDGGDSTWTAAAPVENAEGTESTPDISPDGMHMVFAVKRAADPEEDADLYERTHAQTWQPASALDINSSATDDVGPARTPDGRRLVFVSNRDGDIDLYEAVLATGSSSSWSEPVRLAGHVNTTADEASPHLSSDGLTIYFHREIGGDADLYVARRATLDVPFEMAMRIEALATPADEKDPWLSEDQQEIYFYSDRSVPSPGIYYARRK